MILLEFVHRFDLGGIVGDRTINLVVRGFRLDGFDLR
jgi:hypothetical protein